MGMGCFSEKSFHKLLSSCWRSTNGSAAQLWVERGERVGLSFLYIHFIGWFLGLPVFWCCCINILSIWGLTFFFAEYWGIIELHHIWGCIKNFHPRNRPLLQKKLEMIGKALVFFYYKMAGWAEISYCFFAVRSECLVLIYLVFGLHDLPQIIQSAKCACMILVSFILLSGKLSKINPPFVDDFSLSEKGGFHLPYVYIVYWRAKYSTKVWVVFDTCWGWCVYTFLWMRCPYIANTGSKA